MKVTEVNFEVYKINLVYFGGFVEEEFYLIFRDEDSAYLYCELLLAGKEEPVEFSCELICKVNF